MELGAQFFTLRDFCKTPEGLAESLRRVADMGYRTVQISGTCPFDAQWMAQRLAENGLRCVITHTPMDKIREQTALVIDEHKTFGCRYVGIGCAPHCFGEGEADMDALQATIDAAAAPLKEAGMLLMYHNHACEFGRDAQGRTYWQRLVEGYDETLLGFTLDTFWAQLGGQNVPKLIRDMKGRVPCVHLKDLAVRVNTPATAPVGWGNLDFESIIAACADAGTQYLLVEQDDCFEEDPFDCLKKSIDYLHALGLQ